MKTFTKALPPKNRTAAEVIPASDHNSLVEAVEEIRAAVPNTPTDIGAAPTTHAHSIGDITSLQATLDAIQQRLSNLESGTTAPVVSAPTALVITADAGAEGTGQVVINKTSGGIGANVIFDLYRATSATGTPIASGAGIFPYTDSNRAIGTEYAYTAVARNDGGRVTSNTTRATPTAAPTGGTTTPVVTTPTAEAGTSTPARWWIPVGGTPINRLTYRTGVNSAGQFQVFWVGSMPEARAGSSIFEMGIPLLAQNAFQAYVVDLSTGSTVADSGVVSSTAESWTATALTPVAGRRYQAYARVRSADGKWSAYASTRAVAPTGKVLYLEDFGADPTGVKVSGADYGNGITTGPIRQAIAAAAAGDVIRSRKQGITLTGVTTSGTSLTRASGGFTSAMVGKPVIVYGGGSRTTASVTAFRSTISSVASDGKSAALAQAPTTAQSSARVLIDYATYLTGHIDNDQGAGGFTFDGTGCVFTSNDPDSAGFRTTKPDVTYIGIHYQHKNVTVRGAGKNNNSGTFFTEGTAAVGGRFIGCYSEKARDAGWLFYAGPTDQHVVDCTVDHSMADPFHVTGSAHGIQFIRNTSFYVGDDAVANIGYRGDGDAARPYDIVWENPRTYGQDWGRGLSFGGSKDILATDVIIDSGAMAAFLIGSDGDQANTDHVQVRGFTVTNPTAKWGQKPTYSQGAGTGSVINNDPWLKLLNASSSTAQSNILLENGTVADGKYLQVISYGGGTFADASVILRGITMTGSVNPGSNWADDSTYRGHIDLRGITVPSGSTPASAPTNSNGVVSAAPSGGSTGTGGTGSTGGSSSDTTPPVITGFSGTRTSGAAASLTWSASDNVAITGLTLWRTISGGTPTQIATLSPSATGYSDTGLGSGNGYYYELRAVDAAGNTTVRNTTVNTYTGSADETAPVISSFTGTRTGNATASLSWSVSDNVGVTGLTLFRTISGGTPTQIATLTVGSTSYSDTGLGSGNGYYYELRAVDAAGNSTTKNTSITTYG